MLLEHAATDDTQMLVKPHFSFEVRMGKKIKSLFNISIDSMKTNFKLFPIYYPEKQ